MRRSVLSPSSPRPFQMEGIIRKDDTPQHKAVREAVTNSIIHADLMLNGLLRLVKYDDRYEITNPGLLKLPVEQIYAGDETKARNQCIQVMLRMIGYGENIGSGFPLILQAWEQKHWMRPELIEQPELMQTKLILRVAPSGQNVIKDGENVLKDVLKDSAGNQPNTLESTSENVLKTLENVLKLLNERQRIILRMIIEEPELTWNDISQRVNVSSKTVQRDIQKLKDLKILFREGGNKNGRWIVIKS